MYNFLHTVDDMYITHENVCVYTATLPPHTFSPPTLCHTNIVMIFHAKTCQELIFSAERLEKYLGALFSLNVF